MRRDSRSSQFGDDFAGLFDWFTTRRSGCWRNTHEHGNAATLDGAITKLDPPRSLDITADWGMTGSPDPGSPTTLAWELEPEGGHTVLHFTNTVAAPADDPRTAAVEDGGQGVQVQVPAGGEVDIAHPEARFEPIRRAYADRSARA